MSDLTVDVKELLAQADAAKMKRIEDMPTEQDAIDAMFRAHLRLRDDLGWREVIYAPKNVPLDVIEPGSTGIHYATRDEQGRFWIHDGDTWPSRPVLFRLRATENPSEKEGK